jgi:hypothetical protein
MDKQGTCHVAVIMIFLELQDGTIKGGLTPPNNSRINHIGRLGLLAVVLWVKVD